MKRLTLFTFLALAVGACKGQTSTKSDYSAGICECLDSLGKKEGGVHENFPACLNLSYERNSVALETELKNYGSNSEQAMARLNDDIITKVSIDLIESCDSYYRYTDSLQQHRKIANKDSLHNLLMRVQEHYQSSKDKGYYEYVTNLYFQLEDYDNALKNSDSLLVMDTTNPTALFTKGYVAYKQGKYSEAIILFEKVAKVTNKSGFLIYAALSKRKGRDL